MQIKFYKIAAFFSVFFFILNPSCYSQGDLMILPKRLVFDGSQRSQDINLANTGSDSATYAISIIQYKMTEDGNFEEITEPEDGQFFATDFLRYYPRRVTLPPNEAQTIRVQLTKTGNLSEGEYRSHIYFRAVEEQVALGQEETSEKENTISINIKAIFGISIPVIIRNGESTTSIELSDINLELEKENPKLSIVINRSGNMSVYGDLTVIHVAENGTRTQVGAVKGISVYTPNEKRNFSFFLQNADTIDLQNGKLLISYSAEGNKILDTSELILK